MGNALLKDGWCASGRLQQFQFRILHPVSTPVSVASLPYYWNSSDPVILFWFLTHIHILTKVSSNSKSVPAGHIRKVCANICVHNDSSCGFGKQVLLYPRPPLEENRKSFGSFWPKWKSSGLEPGGCDLRPSLAGQRSEALGIPGLRCR